jgi:SAM-dependent methyltransferase
MGESAKSVVPGESFQYYDGTIYWNNFEPIVDHWNVAITGSSTTCWYEYIRDHFGPFDRALFVNCGNGWVERDLFRFGAIRSAVGFDISSDLLSQARQEAAKIGMPSQYLVADCNIFDLTVLGQFDLIVNYAAFHHVAYLNRMTEKIAAALKPSGIFAALDYVGPHRNQYEWNSWSNVLQIYDSLPCSMRSEPCYPHITSMIATDPTEAIHSELILEVVQRHFDLALLVHLGGSIAYPLLFNNLALYNARHTEKGRELVSQILRLDQAYTAEYPASSLFDFWIARPKKTNDEIRLRAWQDEENDREHAAIANGGRYYPPAALELIYNLIYELKGRAEQFTRPA